MSKYQLRNFSLFLMRKQPVSVSVSRGFFGHERGFAKIGMQRPLLWHIQLKLRSFFCWAQAKSILACAAFWSQQQTNGRNGTMKWFFTSSWKSWMPPGDCQKILPKSCWQIGLSWQKQFDSKLEVAWLVVDWGLGRNTQTGFRLFCQGSNIDRDQDPDILSEKCMVIWQILCSTWLHSKFRRNIRKICCNLLLLGNFSPRQSRGLY